MATLPAATARKDHGDPLDNAGTTPELVTGPVPGQIFGRAGVHLANVGLMPLYVCSRWEDFVSAREGQALKRGRAGDLHNCSAPPADVPLIPSLFELLGAG